MSYLFSLPALHEYEVQLSNYLYEMINLLFSLSTGNNGEISIVLYIAILVDVSSFLVKIVQVI